MTKLTFSTWAALATSALLMAGCIHNDPENPPQKPVGVNLDPNCMPERVDPFIGKHKDTLPAALTKGDVRIIGPNMAVTMDYAPHRLNIVTDKGGIITGANCG